MSTSARTISAGEYFKWNGGAYSSESNARRIANCPTGNAIVMHRFSSRFPVVLPRCGFGLRLDWGNPIPDKAALSTFHPPVIAA